MSAGVAGLLFAVCLALSILALVSLVHDRKRKKSQCHILAADQVNEGRTGPPEAQASRPLPWRSAAYVNGWRWGRALSLAISVVAFGCFGWYWQTIREVRASATATDQISAPARPALSADAIFARSSPAVVQVVTQDGRGRPSTGSGFLVSTKNLLATNYHVIKKAHNAHVVLADKTRLPVLGVAALDEEADIAIIMIAGEIGAQPLELAGNDLPPVGAKVYAIGTPLGRFANTLSDGLVSGHREKGAVFPGMPSMIQTTAAVSHGSSGGPLLGDDGKVRGVMTLGFSPEGENLNLAIPASHVERLLRRCEDDVELTQFPLSRQSAPEGWVSKPDLSPESKEAELVQQIKKKLVAGMPAHEVVNVIWLLAHKAFPDSYSVQQGTVIARYFPFEGRRGPGSTGLLYRLNLKYVNSFLVDWTVRN
jgi:S1-C subfamily serine protease